MSSAALQNIGEAPASPTVEHPADQARILLAEDQRSVRTFIARALRRHGFEVFEAADGLEAVECAKTSMPDLAIVDLRMPRMDGFEVVRTFKQAHGTALPVLVLSGMDEPEERVRAFEAGADDFIPKPVYMQELLKRVDAFERTRAAYREARQANERADRLRLFSAEAAALLAHDLNNGLSIANANLQYLQEQLRLEGEEHEAMAATTRALRRMIGLVRNFVDISRLEDAAIKPEPLDVNVHELLTSAAIIHDPRTGADGGRVIHVDAEQALMAHIDPVLVERVIHNLLNNATRYVNPGGTIGLRGHLVTAGDQRELHIGVGNTGTGIPTELRSNLFSKYRKGSDGKAQRGMGLYFCRMACEAHGGTIAVCDDSQYNTYFLIRLPLGPARQS